MCAAGHAASCRYPTVTCSNVCTPQVGGLGDVVTALGRAVQEQGHLVEVCLPKYEFFNYSPVLQVMWVSSVFCVQTCWGWLQVMCVLQYVLCA